MKRQMYYIGIDGRLTRGMIGIDGRPTRGMIGIDGKPIERTPETHPYSYDPFFEYMAPEYSESDRMVYHDRMRQWDAKAFRNAVALTWPDKAENQGFYDKDPRDVEKFLGLYFGKPVHLTGVLRGCNVGNGYPYWIFCYTEVTE